MIIYSPELSPKFSEFGINVPIKDDRSLKVYEQLRKRFGDNFFSKESKIIDKEDVALVHSPEYVNELFGPDLEKALKRTFDDGIGGTYYVGSPEKKPEEFLQSILAQAGATYQCMKNALAYDFCYFLGGGMHHAMTTHGRGFCLINDVMIAIRKLQKTNFINTAWVIDLDAHKGDGTAQITQGDKKVFTLSIHMAKGWPLDKEDTSGPEFLPSTIDIPIAEGEESQYNRKLSQALDQLQVLAKGLPDIAIIVDGSDPYEKDALPGTHLLKLSSDQMLQRNLIVYEWFKRKCVAQAYVMGGGYGDDSWRPYANFLEKVHGGQGQSNSQQGGGQQGGGHQQRRGGHHNNHRGGQQGGGGGGKRHFHKKR